MERSTAGTKEKKESQRTKVLTIAKQNNLVGKIKLSRPDIRSRRHDYYKAIQTLTPISVAQVIESMNNQSKSLSILAVTAYLRYVFHDNWL